MTSLIPVGVAGLGRYAPDKRLTNQDLEQMVDTSDEWIVQRTGISERRIAAPEQVTSTISVLAARQALEDAGMEPEELDLVLCATVTGDQPFPATACRIGFDLGATNAGGHDIGGWHVVVLNSECDQGGGCHAGPPLQDGTSRPDVSPARKRRRSTENNTRG